MAIRMTALQQSIPGKNKCSIRSIPRRQLTARFNLLVEELTFAPMILKDQMGENRVQEIPPLDSILLLPQVSQMYGLKKFVISYVLAVFTLQGPTHPSDEGSFETSVSTYKPKRRNIPENVTFYDTLLYIKRLLVNSRNYNVLHNVII
jgi:hypothetical protein